MQFDMKDLLQAIGPTASLVFAAWIFLSFLESRYTAAFERYRALTQEFRKGTPGPRHDSIRRQILLYKRRCTWMRWATDIGVVSAMLLICTLLVAAANVVFPAGHEFLPPLGAAFATIGLVMVIAAAALVLVENGIVKHALEEELSDLPELQPQDERPPARAR